MDRMDRNSTPDDGPAGAEGPAAPAGSGAGGSTAACTPRRRPTEPGFDGAGPAEAPRATIGVGGAGDGGSGGRARPSLWAGVRPGPGTSGRGRSARRSRPDGPGFVAPGEMGRAWRRAAAARVCGRGGAGGAAGIRSGSYNSYNHWQLKKQTIRGGHCCCGGSHCAPPIETGTQRGVAATNACGPLGVKLRDGVSGLVGGGACAAEHAAVLSRTGPALLRIGFRRLPACRSYRSTRYSKDRVRDLFVCLFVCLFGG
jgi:hypothetical protein